MKKYALLTVLGICFFVCTSIAQPYRSSLGVLTNAGIKDYYGTGPVFKMFFSKNSAAEANLYFAKSGYYLSLLYLYNFPLDKKRNFNGYAGVGIYNLIYPRAAIGLEYKFENTPISVTADWRPYYIYFSDDDIDPNEGYRHFGLSLRYILKK